MSNPEDFLSNAKSYGTTPPYHKVEIVRNEIIYVPDREEYPVYWEQKAREEAEQSKLRCSYKRGLSYVIDYMIARRIFLNLEEFSILSGYLSSGNVSRIEEEFFELDRSELLVLTTYHNLTPFVFGQLAKAYPIKTREPFIYEDLYRIYAASSDKESRLLVLEKYGNKEKQIIIPWMTYMKFLKEKEFDIPQYTVPEY